MLPSSALTREHELRTGFSSPEPAGPAGPELGQVGLSTTVEQVVHIQDDGEARTGTRDAERLWAEAARTLRSRFPAATWKASLEGVEATEADGTQLRLNAPNAFVKDRLEHKYRSDLMDAVTEAAGRELAIHIDVRPKAAESSNVHVPEVPAGRLRRAEDVALSERYTFDAFITGASNTLAHAAARAVAESPSRSYNPLLIHGDTGLGKTHLLHAIGNYVRENFRARRVHYVPTETLLNDFVESIRNRTTLAFKRHYRQCDVLLVDDIQFLQGKESLQEEFFHTFNSLYDASKQIVLTSDRPTKMIAVDERLRSRIAGGLVAPMQHPELEVRLAILRQKASALQVAVPDDVLELIATNITDNVRELEGALIRVTAYGKYAAETLTPEAAERVLSDILAGQRRQITPDLILRATADLFGFPVEELCGPSRRRPLVTARQVSMYVFRELTDFSYPAIAKQFGGRDHTTVIHAVEKIGNLMKEQRSVFDQVTQLIQRVRAGG